MKRIVLVCGCLIFAFLPAPAQEKGPKLPKEGVKLSLVSVKPLDSEDKEHAWVTFHFKIDNNTGKELTVFSHCFSAFDGLTMFFLDRDGKTVRKEAYVERCSPMFEAKAYLLKPGKNEGSINCRLTTEMFNKVRGFQMSGTLPGSAYEHALESNTVKLEGQP